MFLWLVNISIYPIGSSFFFQPHNKEKPPPKDLEKGEGNSHNK